MTSFHGIKEQERFSEYELMDSHELIRELIDRDLEIMDLKAELENNNG
jgi:hypothetical protein